MIPMTTDWIFRIGDGVHFAASQSKNTWGVDSTHNWTRAFLRESAPGDRLWFVKSGTGGKVLAVASLTQTRPRVVGPLIALTPTNEELGWTKTHGDWDTEVQYSNFYDVSRCEILTSIKSPLVIRKYNPDKCSAALPDLYPLITRFSRARAKTDS